MVQSQMEVCGGGDVVHVGGGPAVGKGGGGEIHVFRCKHFVASARWRWQHRRVVWNRRLQQQKVVKRDPEHMGVYGNGDDMGVWPLTSEQLQEALEPWLSKPKAVQMLQEEANLEFGSLDVNHGGFRQNAERWIHNISHDKYYRPLDALVTSARFRLEREYSPESPGASLLIVIVC